MARPIFTTSATARVRALTVGECKLQRPACQLFRGQNRVGLIYDILQNPAKVTRGLQREQAAREKANKPLREQLARVEAQLAALDEREARLLDLYSGTASKKDKLNAEQAVIDKGQRGDVHRKPRRTTGQPGRRDFVRRTGFDYRRI